MIAFAKILASDVLPVPVSYTHLSVIEAFLEGEYDVLVCTTIIESGVDMPRVNTLIVEDADRFGLAQLYQIRGRVGRSERQAYALITYRPDRVIGEAAEKRLAAIRDFTELGSGFQIALRDLEVRGAGNLLGAEQSGHLESIGYDLYTRMLEETVREAKGLEPPPQRVQTVVDLTVDAILSADYVSESDERLDIYRRIASIDTLDDYRDVFDLSLIHIYPDSQRSTHTIRRVDIPPAREIVMTDEEREATADRLEIAMAEEIARHRRNGVHRDVMEKLQANGFRDLERLKEKMHFPSLDRLLPLIDEEVYTVADFVRDASPLLFLDEPLTYSRRLDAAHAGFIQRLTGLMEKGDRCV